MFAGGATARNDLELAGETRRYLKDVRRPIQPRDQA
jgi:hypothetical protein